MHSNIFAHVDPSPAPEQSGGSLSGKRVGVQSLFCVRGWPCEGGSRALEGFRPLEDATVVRRINEEGAVLAGCTRSSELGLGIVGDGTAQAVVEGHVDVALMADTLGEARVAAARAGLCAFKPSWGTVSRFGLTGLAPSLECCGVLAGEPGDLARVIEVVAHADERDPSMVHVPTAEGEERAVSQKNVVRAGVLKGLPDLLGSGESTAFSRAVSRLDKGGLAIEEVPWEDFGLFAAAHQVIAAVEASSSCGKYDGVRFGHRASGAKNWNDMYLETRRESFGLLLKTFLFQGAYFQFENYGAFENACRIRARLVREMEKVMKNLDVLVLPTLNENRDAASARSVEAIYEAFAFTLPANVTGQPAVTLPGFMGSGGQDTGLQLVGVHGRDRELTALAQKLVEQREGTA